MQLQNHHRMQKKIRCKSNAKPKQAKTFGKILLKVGKVTSTQPNDSEDNSNSAFYRLEDQLFFNVLLERKYREYSDEELGDYELVDMSYELKEPCGPPPRYSQSLATVFKQSPSKINSPDTLSQVVVVILPQIGDEIKEVDVADEVRGSDNEGDQLEVTFTENEKVDDEEILGEDLKSTFTPANIKHNDGWTLVTSGRNRHNSKRKMIIQHWTPSY